LAEYPTARAREPFTAGAEMWRLFSKLEDDFQALEEVRAFGTLRVKASVGQGNWAKVPWIAFLDERETQTTTPGVYVVLLFRQDGSGLYATLNQGVTEPSERLGDAGGLQELKAKAQNLRQRPESKALEQAGFQLNDTIDLRADARLGQRYESATVA